MLGSYYKTAADRPRSATARNIGYTDEMAEKYPWVRQVTQEMEADDKGAPVAGNASSS